MLCVTIEGRGNGTVVSVSVYQAGDPGSRPARSACHRKVEFYHCVIHSFPPVLTTGSKKAAHVLLCLCNNACKRSLAICRKSGALCLVSRLLFVPVWSACAEQGRSYDSNKQTNKQTNNRYLLLKSLPCKEPIHMFYLFRFVMFSR